MIRSCRVQLQFCNEECALYKGTCRKNIVLESDSLVSRRSLELVFIKGTKRVEQALAGSTIDGKEKKATKWHSKTRFLRGKLARESNNKLRSGVHVALHQASIVIVRIRITINSSD